MSIELRRKKREIALDMVQLLLLWKSLDRSYVNANIAHHTNQVPMIFIFISLLISETTENVNKIKHIYR